MNNTSVPPATEKTLDNIRRAKAFSAWAGPWHIEWKLRTGNFLFIPRFQSMETEFFNEGPVIWRRFYWLTFGLSWYRLIH